MKHWTRAEVDAELDGLSKWSATAQRANEIITEILAERDSAIAAKTVTFTPASTWRLPDFLGGRANLSSDEARRAGRVLWQLANAIESTPDGAS